MKLISITVLMLISVACSQNVEKVKDDVNKGNEFTEAVITNLSQDYDIYDKQIMDSIVIDSVRSGEFVTPDLISVSRYIFKSKEKINYGFNYLHFYLYTYNEGESSDWVIQRIEDLKERRRREKEYGPMGKGYSLFFQAKNYVVHFAGFCDGLTFKQWEKQQNEILNLARKYFEVNKVVEKPCEDPVLH